MLNLKNSRKQCISLGLVITRRWGSHLGFPGGAGGKEPDCQCRRYRRYGFNPLGREDPLEEDMQPRSVFLPGESHVQRSLVGYSPWDCKELGKTERLTLSLHMSAVSMMSVCIGIMCLPRGNSILMWFHSSPYSQPSWTSLSQTRYQKLQSHASQRPRML